MQRVAPRPSDDASAGQSDRQYQTRLWLALTVKVAIRQLYFQKLVRFAAAVRRSAGPSGDC